jgi:uncharacterized protein
MRQLTTELGDDDRFSVYFKELSRLGSANDKQIPVFFPNDRKRAVQKLMSEFGILMRAASDMDESAHYCYASALNSFVIRADGRVGKCTVALDHETNQLGRLSEQGTLAIDGGKLMEWAHGLQTLRQSDLACPFSALSKRRLQANQA